MEETRELQAEIKIGEPGYVNKNCWLARNLNYPPTKHCQYCQLKFQNCVFFRYSIISLILIIIIFTASFLIEGNISKLLIISVFILIIIYGYFFDKSTESIIEANFAQSKAKEALEDLTEHLQQKVDEQTKELKEAYEVEKKAKEGLELLDKTKNQFLLTIQHHLRTPLTSMMGYGDLLLKGQFGKLSKKVTEVVKRCQNSTKSLVKMVNEFLDITQFQLGKEVAFLKADVQLEPILDEIIDELKFQTKSKGIYLKMKKPEKISAIRADENKLKAALFNIVDNAVKYTQKGGVEVKITNDHDHVIKISVSDTGMGMSEDNLKNLFGKIFERSDQAKKTFATGRGIGLYLSDQIIKAHNGKIWAESEGEGKGSTFNIILPIGQQTENIVAKPMG